MHAFYVRRGHWGAFSGISRLMGYLDPARVRLTATAVEDDDEWYPAWLPFRLAVVRNAVRGAIQRRGLPWYKLSDLGAEAMAAAPWLLGRYDVLHYLDGEHTAQFLPALPPALRRRGAAVATYHQPPSILPQVVTRDVLRRLDHITVVSTSQLDYFRKFIPASRLSVLYHGIDTEFFRPPAVRDDRPTFTCLTVGSYLRDWEMFVEIARLLRPYSQIVLHVVSTSAPPLDPLGNVVVHTRLEDTALRSLYEQADVLLLPLVDGTANNALLEAMAMGLPSVASDLPGIREYAGDESARFAARIPDAFVEHLLGLWREPARRAAMGRAARARAEALSWPHVAETYLGMYQRVS